MLAWLFIPVVAALAWLGPAAAPEAAEAMTDAPSGLVFCLHTDKFRYAAGETIHLTLTLANQTTEDVVLRFHDAQRFDFALSREGKEVWRWSQGMMFVQVLGEEKLNPGKSLHFAASCDAGLPPGDYHARGVIVAAPLPLTASVPIEIR